MGTREGNDPSKGLRLNVNYSHSILKNAGLTLEDGSTASPFYQQTQTDQNGNVIGEEAKNGLKEQTYGGNLRFVSNTGPIGVVASASFTHSTLSGSGYVNSDNQAFPLQTLIPTTNDPNAVQNPVNTASFENTVISRNNNAEFTAGAYVGNGVRLTAEYGMGVDWQSDFTQNKPYEFAQLSLGTFGSQGSLEAYTRGTFNGTPLLDAFNNSDRNVESVVQQAFGTDPTLRNQIASMHLHGFEVGVKGELHVSDQVSLQANLKYDTERNGLGAGGGVTFNF